MRIVPSSVSILAGLLLSPVAPTLAAGQAPAAPSCDPDGPVVFVCEQSAPEDLVVVPGEQWVVASAYGGNGGIYLINARDKRSLRAYPAETAADRFDSRTYNTCPGPPDAAATAKFLTHGLYLQAGRDQRHRLYAVHHGSREAVEVFELDASRPVPSLTWVGCAVAPDPVGLNSVRGLPDGGFVASNFLARDVTAEERQAMMGGKPNGELWYWSSDGGWRQVPGSQAAGANGLELSGNGDWLYVAAWGSQSFFKLMRVRRPPLDAAPAREEVDLGFRVDNIRWARDGSILAAGQGGAPGSQYSTVVSIDPETLEVREVLRRPDSPAFGAGTVAVEVGDEIWVGSFRGDRIAVFPAP